MFGVPTRSRSRSMAHNRSTCTGCLPQFQRTVLRPWLPTLFILCDVSAVGIQVEGRDFFWVFNRVEAARITSDEACTSCWRPDQSACRGELGPRRSVQDNTGFAAFKVEPKETHHGTHTTKNPLFLRPATFKKIIMYWILSIVWLPSDIIAQPRIFLDTSCHTCRSLLDTFPNHVGAAPSPTPPLHICDLCPRFYIPLHHILHSLSFIVT